MIFTLGHLTVVAIFFFAMLALQQLGRRIGERDERERPGKPGGAAADGAVYGLLGLLLAFEFSGAGARFEARRHLVTAEANAIGTAWLRLDLLPPERQPALRDLFREYIDVRIERYEVVPDFAAVAAARRRSAALQKEIWSASVAAVMASAQVAPATAYLPSINAMIDVTSSREDAEMFHPPWVVFFMLGALLLVTALFAGHGLAGKPRARFQVLGFAGVMTLALYVIVDYEFPRVGLIRVDRIDAVMTDLRQSMQ